MVARLAMVFLGLMVLLSACGGSANPAPSASGGTGAAPATGPRRIVAAIMGDPPTISAHSVLAGTGTIPGGDALTELLGAGLSLIDEHGELRPQLADAIPSLENGRWTLLPEGRMVTTWTIRQGASWHDGVRFTADDIVFTTMLAQQRELPIFGNAAFDVVESVEAPDPRTVRVTWKRPYIQADHLFGVSFAPPRPRHILEQPLLESEDKTVVLQHPYWTNEHVGAGAFKLRDWVRGSHIVMTANDAYVLGRPKLDEIEVRFIPDGNALFANILAGTVELTMGRNLSLQQAMQLREQWQGGRIDVGITDWIAVYPQLLNPTPQVLLDPRFRRALAHGLDRSQLVETLQYGLVPVAHSFVNPNEPVYKEIEADIVRYEYDPRRATQLVEALGFQRAADNVFRDAAGQAIALEVRTSGGDDTHEIATMSVADAYKRLGLGTEPFFIPQAQRTDREYNSTYPGLRVWRLPNDLGGVDRYLGSNAPSAENRFNGSNRSRYINAEFDALIVKYMSTIPAAERTGYLRSIVHHMTDQVTILGLWYNTEAIVIGNRLQNVSNKRTGEANQPWNAEQWDTKG